VKRLFVAFGLVAGLAALLAEFFAYETRVDYGYQTPPPPEQRRTFNGEAEQSLRDAAPTLFE
jgi:hypothetical protein